MAAEVQAEALVPVVAPELEAASGPAEAAGPVAAQVLAEELVPAVGAAPEEVVAEPVAATEARLANARKCRAC